MRAWTMYLNCTDLASCHVHYWNTGLMHKNIMQPKKYVRVCFLCRDKKVITSINNIKTKLRMRSLASPPNYTDRISESHAEVLKSTQTDSRGDVHGEELLVQGKVPTRHAQVSRSSLGMCPDCITTLCVPTDDNNAQEKTACGASGREVLLRCRFSVCQSV